MSNLDFKSNLKESTFLLNDKLKPNIMKKENESTIQQIKYTDFSSNSFKSKANSSDDKQNSLALTNIDFRDSKSVNEKNRKPENTTLAPKNLLSIRKLPLSPNKVDITGINSTALNTKIIGGYEAIPHSAPYIVSLQFGESGKHGCAGSLIAPNVILSAAHCLRDGFTDIIHATVGIHDRLNPYEKGVQKLPIDYYVKHEKFGNRTSVGEGGNDIALLFTKGKFKLNNIVKLIRLTDSHVPYENEAILFGWGRTNPKNRDKAEYLQTIEADLLTYKQCQKLIPDNKRLHYTNLCTGGFDEKSQACHGDSGGPLVQKIHENARERLVNLRQIGIVSWGKQRCGLLSQPSIYTNIGYHLKWIARTLEKYNIFLLNDL